MKQKIYLPIIGFAFIFIGLVLAKPAPIVYAGFTSTPTSQATDTPIPVATDTPVPTNTPAAVSTPRPQNTPSPVDTPIPTPDVIPELGAGPSATFIRFGVVGFLLVGLFLIGSWLKLLQTD